MTRMIALLCLVLSLPLLIHAAPVVAFVDINVIPMDKEHILAHQTVIVRNGTRPRHDFKTRWMESRPQGT